MFLLNPSNTTEPCQNGKHLTDQSAPCVVNDLSARLQDRAKTASAILGRRHFQKHQQMLQREMLRGVKIGSNAGDCSIINTDANADRRCTKETRTVISSSKSSFERRENYQFRPKTAAVYPYKYASAKDVSFLEHSLQVLSLKCYRKSSQRTYLLKPSNDAQKYDGLCIDNAFAIENKTENGERDVDVTVMTSLREKSAPSPSSEELSSLVRKKITENSLSVFWKTRERNVDHNKTDLLKFATTTEIKKNSDRKLIFRRQMLRERPKTTISGFGGCPYQCRSCFRAFFASEDYLQTLTTKLSK
ncbi:hypothetical protein DPMN_049860 [Dreissena polymorpha]|uniref:Uncharacterized protein n=1 Tax=Dreissena polymorpha TaxID=45954 RepID=A0A9D4CGC4_DREPO|nr:hypothetical protein DPMN_049860 [Dreissena polymorpha]